MLSVRLYIDIRPQGVLMGIWKMNISRNYCVIAYAMLLHSVHSPIPVKGIPEPPLEIAWIARFFFTTSGWNPENRMIWQKYRCSPSNPSTDT